ncbi:MAG: amino acid adenylation enzyme/thioester reductase family protein [Nocardioidaceae bacterium]|nr:amino acid adenylation enzyme/thioester reductase family protein [Nocardioidaceae bacterium]
MAPPWRTLVDIFNQTVADFPDQPALDNGATVLTYAELSDAADEIADALNRMGIGPGDRVGVRINSGTTELYIAILGTLVAGAAYVPVDVDDPDTRARTVFDEAEVSAIIGNELVIASRGLAGEVVGSAEPGAMDDAWIIFTSGSTGTPKGVAVRHESAAAFVDAEARIFLQDAPLGPGDRVMAGLSVAFDASCEEMWLAWRHGACLVPAPRSLVKSGVDLGPWMIANDITVVSTVPTLVALWPADALDAVRLLILGGEACPPEIGARLASEEREVWNTYGPTEATVVASAARLTAEPPVRIGLPLDGWDLAVVDGVGQPVAPGESGELIIGGVGLARYLDPGKDAEKYAPMPSLGWERAYRSGDLVTYDEAGLLYVGRIDEQIKLGGRRIELGEIDSALLALPGVEGAAAAIRMTGAGNRILVGYITTSAAFDAAHALTLLRERMPAALVPRLAQVDTLPTRTSGKIDRDALPWPLATLAPAASGPLRLSGTAEWLRQLWLDILGAVVTNVADDFFTLGGGSLTAAQLVSRLRARFPEATVADIYEHPSIVGLAAALDAMATPTGRRNRAVRPVPFKTQTAQIVASLPLRTLGGARWLVWIAAGNNIASSVLDLTWLPHASWWWIALGWALLIAPPGRMLLAAAGARLILRGVGPGDYPRGGKVHLRLWLAERFVDELGAVNVAGATWMTWYARALGASIGSGVDLHSIPPVTGLLTLADGCSIEPEVDLFGHWLDGDILHVGRIEVGESARVGVRSTLGPGAQVGAHAEVAPGAAVSGLVPEGAFWSGSPAQPIGRSRGPLNPIRPPLSRHWQGAYSAMAITIASLPLVAVVAGLAAVAAAFDDATSLGAAAGRAYVWIPAATLLGWAVLAALIVLVVRLLSLGLVSGTHPIHGRQAFQAWAIVRVMDEARDWLFPLYSSSLTPAWLRLLGARIGSNVEASTVLLIPKLTTVNDGAFLADDTMLGMYELGGGWLRIETVKIGKHAFVGNSGMTAPGRKVPKGGLVAVLSAAPRRSKAKAGTSWLGSPPTKLRRTASAADISRTYEPAFKLRVARAVMEICRVVPVLVTTALAVSAVVVLEVAVRELGWFIGLALSGAVLLIAGFVAAALATAAKWGLVGRLVVSDYPLWSSFVWRNELADTFVEVLAAPWFARSTTGSPLLNIWLRSLGAKIGKGVWCETYWLPEADLIELRDGVTVNRGCVVQTHLFHDRTLSMDTVTLSEGATLGPNSVILPAATLGKHATVGPVSLVMRGETVPRKTRWIGNPIGPWTEEVDPSRSADD